MKCKNCGGDLGILKGFGPGYVFCPVCGWFRVENEAWLPCDHPDGVTESQAAESESAPITEAESSISDENQPLPESGDREPVTQEPKTSCRSRGAFLAPALFAVGILTIFMARAIGIWKKKNQIPQAEFPRLSR